MRSGKIPAALLLVLLLPIEALPVSLILNGPACGHSCCRRGESACCRRARASGNGPAAAPARKCPGSCAYAAVSSPVSKVGHRPAALSAARLAEVGRTRPRNTRQLPTTAAQGRLRLRSPPSSI
jgi:hypothetical protein